MKHRTRLLSTSTLCFSTILLVTSFTSLPAVAFDPDEDSAPVAAAPSTLPSTQTLTETRTRSSTVAFPRIIRPAAPAPIQFAPLKPAAPVVAAPAVIVPAPAPEVASAPVVVAPPPAVVEVPPAPLKRIEFPPVDPAVMAKAKQQLAATPPPVGTSTPVAVVPVTPVPPSVASAAPAATSANGFIAPLPLVSPVGAVPTVPTAPPVVVPAPAAPVAVTPVPQSVAPAISQASTKPATTEALSRDSKTILGRIPSKLDAPKSTKAGKVALNRNSPNVTPLEVKGAVDAYEAAGIKISVRRPGLDTNYELNRAYTAVTGGDSNAAIEIYKSILSTEPTNADALFGLASVYHRQGQLDKARPLYGTLLQNYPNHRDGINNFLVLVSDEAPQESLAELERLEQRNPDFSPIPAQQAIVLTKLGYHPQARDKMLRAIELAPDNLAYKYNLAIMLDRQGDYPGAAALYKSLIDAANKGGSIPTSVDSLQKRLNYISATMNTARVGAN